MPTVGDVVLVDFPGATGVKRRPAVIVSTDVYHAHRPDVILCLLTTQHPTAMAPTDYLLQVWSAAGLRAPSVFRRIIRGSFTPAAAPARRANPVPRAANSSRSALAGFARVGRVLAELPARISIMERPWRIDMLGWLRATRADRVIGRFRSRKSGILLAYLAYHHYRSHPREVLIELLWPDSPGHSGRTNLRTELAWLRRRLEPPGVPAGAVLLADGDTLQLNPEGCSSDVAAFEAALQSAAAAASPRERAQALAQAVTLYRGELMPGYFDPWLVPERLRLGEAFLQAVHQLVEVREQAGDLAGALQWAWRAAAADPVREETHADLVRLLTATGQGEAARRQSQMRERLLGSEWEGAWDVMRGGSPRKQAMEQKLRARLAEAEELRRQLTARTAEVEELQQRLLAEVAEKRKLQQELAVRDAEAKELCRR